MQKDQELLFRDMLEGQQKKMLATGQRIVPSVTPDDLLQPNDFPDLENHPHFRYEEGVLEGIRTAYTALLAAEADQRGC
jgi:hypothetical protein